ncbi:MULTISPECIES: hypothetical protein [Streptomyces]|uniref:Secreted protein n=1 Tax=Streptomyces viridochromogenes TaxID=1938 RepID=A0A0L8L8P2_STRVR|nr:MULTISPECIES: hypothetical protein [Streptomyces]KOG34441.1 hypothetical protein ADK34_06865 [Streptomyces viridochromogenes]
MSKTAAATRTALRAAVTATLIVLVTGAGLQTSWADEPVPATGTPGTSATSSTAGTTPEVCDPTGTGTTGTGTTGTGTTGTGTTGTPTCTENNPWD